MSKLKDQAERPQGVVPMFVVYEGKIVTPEEKARLEFMKTK